MHNARKLLALPTKTQDKAHTEMLACAKDGEKSQRSGAKVPETSHPLPRPVPRCAKHWDSGLAFLELHVLANMDIDLLTELKPQRMLARADDAERRSAFGAIINIVTNSLPAETGDIMVCRHRFNKLSTSEIKATSIDNSCLNGR